MEEWRSIEGFDGMYEVSNFGRIKSLSREICNGKNSKRISKDIVRRSRINTKRGGYNEISLRKDGKEYRFKVHRLVATAFIPNDIKERTEVNHIDGDKNNNFSNNLEWCTSKENKAHAWDNGLINSNHRKQKIICIETGVVYESVVECSEKLGIDKRSIFRVLKGDKKYVKGYTFKRIN